MLKAYSAANGALDEFAGKLDAAALRKAQWIDLCDATEEEKKLVERTLKIEVNPVNNYEPFQVSSHFSSNARQLTMTGLLLTLTKNNEASLIKVTFIRARSGLITVSNGGPFGMSSLIKECENCFSNRSGRDDIFAAVLDMIVDHTDNILDKVGHDLDRITNSVFQHHASASRRRFLMASPRWRNRQLDAVLTHLGPTREILVKLRRSVLSFGRMIAFLREHRRADKLMPKLETFERDLKSISEAETDLSATAGFLLDGVVGYIGLLQNKVMNVLTLVTLLLTPAMVVGAIYGMNFKFMPELQWTYGYPLALGVIVLSTAGLWLWMRRSGL